MAYEFVQPQPDFPNEDLDSGNRRVITNLCHDTTTSAFMHAMAEQAQTLYGEVHAVASESRALFPSDELAHWYLTGMSAYEIVGHMTNLSNRQFLPSTVKEAAVTMDETLQLAELENIMRGYHDTLTHDYPSLCEAIAAIVGVRGVQLRFALMGAGTEHAIERSALASDTEVGIPSDELDDEAREILDPIERELHRTDPRKLHKYPQQSRREIVEDPLTGGFRFVEIENESDSTND